MRAFFLVFIAALLFGDGLIVHYQLNQPIILHSPSEISGREDLMGRLEYEQLMLADPETGTIPLNISILERTFEKKHRAKKGKLRAPQLSYESLGPANVGGRTRAVAFDVRDENILLAGGVSGGIWKSENGGATWERKSNPENRNSVTCIVQDVRPGREDTWYHGTGELVGNSARGGDAPFRGDGIYKSEDNGETWELLSSTQDATPNVFNSQFQYIWDIEINPDNLDQDEVLVAAFGGILRSLDGGESWNVSLGQSLFGLAEEVNLNNTSASFYTSIERSANNVFYATLSTETPSDELSPESGIYYSENGADWNEITPVSNDSRYRRVSIGSSPSNPDVTYFMFDSNPILILEHDLSRLEALGRINGFDTTPRELPAFAQDLGPLDTQGSYNMTIRVHPDDSNIVFVGGTNLYRSTDAFRTQENIKWIGGYDPGGGTSVYPGHHPDQHDLLFLPSDPDVAFSANDGGLRRSDAILADSVMWQSSNAGFVTSQFFTIAQSKNIGNAAVIGGMQDNGTDISRDGSLAWDGVIGGDGGYAATTNDEALWFASFQRGQTLRLTLDEENDLTSFGRVDPGGLVVESASAYLFINPFALDPTNGNRMFCAGGNHLYFNPNVSQIPGGSQVPTSLGWSRVNEERLDDGLVSAVEVSHTGERVFFGSSIGQLFRLNNADNQLQFELTELDRLEEGYISSISINPENIDHAIVVFSSYNIPSVYQTLDGGETFTDISGDLEENADGTGSGPSIRWAEIVPLENGYRVLLGTSIGLYAADNPTSGISWVKQGTNLIGRAVIPMMDYRPSDGRLVIATHGNGIFATTISDAKRLVNQSEEVAFQLMESYPNPFQDEVNIRYAIPEDGEVRIDILTQNGSLVNTILWAPQFAGENSVNWSGTTPSGFPLSNGIYLYRIRYNGQSKGGRLILRR